MTYWTQNYFGNLYHEIYSRHLLDPERALEEAAFAAEVLDLGRRTVLDLACGFGRHARLLAAGNKVYALDNNASYLAQMRDGLKERAANNLLPVHGDMRHIPLLDESVDATIMLFNSFGYFGDDSETSDTQPEETRASTQIWKLPSVFYERKLVDPAFGKFRDPVQRNSVQDTNATATSQTDSLALDADNQGVLREAYRVMKKGAGLLLEIPNKDILLEAVSENPRRLAIMADCEIHEQFEWDSQSNRLRNHTKFICGDTEETATYSLRLYEPDEIKKYVTANGFRIKRTYGDYDGRRFGRRSSDIMLIHALKPVRRNTKSPENP